MKPVRRSPQQFYKLALNPFENAIVSVSGCSRLAENITSRFSLISGTATARAACSSAHCRKRAFNTTTGVMGAGRDLNGDGDTLDTIIVANSSVTKTNRPGVTAEINHQLGNHALKVGFWYERAQHKQTGPAVAVDANGNPVDQWLRDGRILRPDGSEFNSRNWLTISPAYQAYFSDQFSFMNDRGLLQFGPARSTSRASSPTSRMKAAAPSTSTASTPSRNEMTCCRRSGALQSRPRAASLRQRWQNFRAPPNFAYAPTNGNDDHQWCRGADRFEISRNPITTDIGYRYHQGI